MTEPSEIRARFQEAASAFLALRPAILAGEPWSLAVAFDHSPEAHWGPPEILAHVAEMVRYWLGEVERIASSASAPASFGRIATDPVRIAIVGRDRTVPLRDLWDRIDSDCARWERRLAELSAAELARAGIHPLAGSMTAGDVAERFVVAHLEDHAAQLRTALSGPSSSPAAASRP